MKLHYRTVIFFGILLWMIPFVVSLIVFPTKTFFPPFFETICAHTNIIEGGIPMSPAGV